jgi:hypothetical protein
VSSYKLVLLAALPGLLAAQTVTLSTTPNPATFGAPVSLTAAVTAFASPLSGPPTGRVTFYDGITVLGSAPLSSGTASFSTLLPAGNRKLRAYYAGDAANRPATSNTVTQTVAAKPVSNFASGPAAGLGEIVSYQPFTADFNGDGIADITASGGGGQFPVVVALSDGQGHLRQTFQYPTGFVIAAGDFTSDGKPDLVISDGNLIRVLPGNGDGAFQSPINTAVTIPQSNADVVAVTADFNGDGKLDLAGPFGILLGNGDGTFQPGAPLDSQITRLIVAGDFNGDRVPDLAISDGVGSLRIFLGNGDGTMRTSPAVPVPGSTFNMAAADFNGDGTQDLALVSFTNGTQSLTILLSKGDGSFQAPALYSTPTSFFILLPGDFNGDGIIDLFLNGVILAGNGDGTFQPLFNFVTSFNARGVVLDLNGDGRPDIFFAAGGTFLGTASTIAATGGTPQSTSTNTPFAAPLEVTVRDGSGAPISGAAITFTAPFSNQSATAVLSSPTAVTDASGIASVTATANNVPGSYTVQAVYQSRIVLFALNNTVGTPATLTSPNPLPQSTAIDTNFPRTLTVVAKDAGGNPVNGVAVTFTAPQTGASALLSSTTRTTDATGTTAIIATANHIPGSYTVTATLGMLSVSFPLTNTLATPATVTLTTSAGTSTFGAPVVLTASVTPSGATGRITFYDGISVLGIKPLASGAASLSTIQLPAGTRKLRAFYSGDTTYASAMSNAAAVRVNAAPAGSFLTPITLNVAAALPVVADFNGDGKADIAYPGTTVLLGKGDGTFGAPIQSPGAPGPMVTGDFNGDGILDLFSRGDILVTKGTVLLGNGDGTFRLGAAYTVPNAPLSVADINGDGTADILIGDLILLGKGDGTFTPQNFSTDTIYDSGVSDFNGDGKPDLVALTVESTQHPGLPPVSVSTYTLSLYPGIVDGNFLPPRQVASATFTIHQFGSTGSGISGFRRRPECRWKAGYSLLGRFRLDRSSRQRRRDFHGPYLQHRRRYGLGGGDWGFQRRWHPRSRRHGFRRLLLRDDRCGRWDIPAVRHCLHRIGNLSHGGGVQRRRKGGPPRKQLRRLFGRRGGKRSSNHGHRRDPTVHPGWNALQCAARSHPEEQWGAGQRSDRHVFRAANGNQRGVFQSDRNHQCFGCGPSHGQSEWPFRFLRGHRHRAGSDHWFRPQ